MTETLTTKNIYQRLVEVRKAVGGHLKKENQGPQYNYVSNAQVLMKVRKAMNAQALMVIPNVKTCACVDRSVQGPKGTRTERLTTMNIEYTVINSDLPEEKIVVSWFAEGIDSGEKGIGKALTYGEKYFYLKLLGIATDSANDDPDAIQEEDEPTKKRNVVKKSPEIISKSEMIRRKLLSLVKKFDRGEEWLEAQMAGISQNYETMSREQYDGLLGMIEELTDELIESFLSEPVTESQEIFSKEKTQALPEVTQEEAKPLPQEAPKQEEPVSSPIIPLHAIPQTEYFKPWNALEKKGYSKEEQEVELRKIYSKLSLDDGTPKESTKQLIAQELEWVLSAIAQMDSKPMPEKKPKSLREKVGQPKEEVRGGDAVKIGAVLKDVIHPSPYQNLLDYAKSKRFKGGEEWLLLTIKGQGYRVETLSQEQAEQVYSIVEAVTQQEITEDLAVLRESPKAEKSNVV